MIFLTVTMHFVPMKARSPFAPVTTFSLNIFEPQRYKALNYVFSYPVPDRNNAREDEAFQKGKGKLYMQWS